jgi:hypothetical protein
MRGRPKKPPAYLRRQIKIYVDPETEANIRATIGLKDLGKKLDAEYSDPVIILAEEN